MNDGFNPRTKLPSTDEVHLRASIDLLMKHGIDQAHLSSVLTLAMGEGGSFADVYLKGTIAESWGLEGGAVRSGSYRCDEGFGIRVLRDEEAIFASSQVIDVESLRRVAGQVRSAVGGSQPGRAVALPVASSRARRSLYETDPPLGMLRLKSFTASVSTVLVTVAFNFTGRSTALKPRLPAASNSLSRSSPLITNSLRATSS